MRSVCGRDGRLASYRALFSAHIDDVALDAIRAATQKGLALGSGRFKTRLDALTERRVTSKKRGPKKPDDGPAVKAREFLL
jgi:putative transposase